jgi:nitrogen fixation NifU-like protein
VASVATELLAGKTVAEAKSLSGEELAAPLGALPPVRIHCAQLVEGALRNALSERNDAPAPKPAAAPTTTTSPTLFDQLSAGTSGKVKIVMATD